jgi:hypothetical protein
MKVNSLACPFKILIIGRSTYVRLEALCDYEHHCFLGWEVYFCKQVSDESPATIITVEE